MVRRRPESPEKWPRLSELTRTTQTRRRLIWSLSAGSLSTCLRKEGNHTTQSEFTVTLTGEELTWLALLVQNQLRLTVVNPDEEHLAWCARLYAKLIDPTTAAAREHTR
jgi:hypothetical protein